MFKEARAAVQEDGVRELGEHPSVHLLWQGSPQKPNRHEAAFFLAHTTKPKKGKCYEKHDPIHNQTYITNEKEVA